VGKTLYFDCFSGASGDMVLGALLDLGLPLEALREALGSLAIDHGAIAAERVVRAGVSATKFRLVEPGAARSARAQSPDHAEAYADAHPPAGGGAHARGHDRRHEHDHGHDHGHQRGQDPDHGHTHEHGADHGHHSLAEIQRSIDRSALSPAAKARAGAMFSRLAEAEAAIHDTPIDRVHLHEVGALDSIVDIVGAVYGMEWLGASDIVASPMNVGSGSVRCAHGVFPVPAPATARLLQGVPVYAAGVARELTTPTGALLVTSYAQRYGTLPPMTIERIGYGAGDRDFAGYPNVLRLVVGEAGSGARTERIVAVECEIDDMNPQLFGPLMDRLYAAGALEVFYAPIQMKKNRPGTLVTILAVPDLREAVTAVLFAETTTIGVRYQDMYRERLEREMQTVETPVGPIRFKVARRDGRVANASAEFEDCARAAADHGLPIKEVQAIATKAWLDRAR
jgi:hypothetical protein